MKAEIKSLAALVTFRQLYNDKKNNIYNIIAQFVESVVLEKNLYRFNITMVSENVRKIYGFNIPDYVIQTALKRISWIKRENLEYHVTPERKEKNEIKKQYENANEKSCKLMQLLESYAEKSLGKLSDEEKGKLNIDFCQYLLDDTNGNSFSSIISAFIVDVQKDSQVKTLINNIKEGAVLYAGINYSNTNNDISNKFIWNEPITIYLEMEILFHLAGYNGVVFKRLAEDLFKLIQEMNSKKKKIISLKYFKEVKKDIENYFYAARKIVDNESYNPMPDDAMTEIVSSCDTSADVIEKEVQFFKTLEKMHIVQAEEYDYYNEKNHKYNLISKEILEEYEINDESSRYAKHINYISILRKGISNKNIKESKYIILSEVGKMLNLSKGLSADKAPFVINMGMLTNLLWFDLKKGFGADSFPANFDVLLKSQIVLSKLMTQSVNQKYKQEMERYRQGERSQDDMAEIILRLREDKTAPENINESNVNSVLEFISEDQLQKYKSEKELLKEDNQEQRKKIKAILKKSEQQKEDIEKYKNKYIAENEEKNKAIEQYKLEKKAHYKENEKRREKADESIEWWMKVYDKVEKAVFVIYFGCIAWLFLYSDRGEVIIALLPIIDKILTKIFPGKKPYSDIVCELLRHKIKNLLKDKIYKNRDIKVLGKDETFLDGK